MNRQPVLAVLTVSGPARRTPMTTCTDIRARMLPMVAVSAAINARSSAPARAVSRSFPATPRWSSSDGGSGVVVRSVLGLWGGGHGVPPVVAGRMGSPAAPAVRPAAGSGGAVGGGAGGPRGKAEGHQVQRPGRAAGGGAGRGRTKKGSSRTAKARGAPGWRGRGCVAAYGRAGEG